MTCDIVLVGVGGQGVLTIGDLLVRAAFAADVPVTFAPTKGMAQRGGFVKAELRLGREGAGPRVADRSADLVVAMERSESLRGLRFLKPGGTFILYDHVWEPTGVMLGQTAYPSRGEVARILSDEGADLRLLDPADVPTFGDRSGAANLFALGGALACDALRQTLASDAVEQVVASRWPKAADENRAVFRAGLAAAQREGDR